MNNVKTREDDYTLIKTYKNLPSAKNILHNLKLRVKGNRNVLTGTEEEIIKALEDIINTYKLCLTTSGVKLEPKVGAAERSDGTETK